ncbi:MAG TPA: ATP-binding protein [Gemmatimonadales bacterium]
MKAEEFTAQLEELRRQVEKLRCDTGLPPRMFGDLLAAVDGLRQSQEQFAESHSVVEQERRRYHQLFQFAPDAYLFTDLAGIVREANRSAARLLGAEPQFMAGKALVSFVAIEDRTRVRAELGRWQSEPTPKRLEVRLQPRQGSPFDAEITLSVARGGPQDTAIGFRWLVRDISAQRQLTEELRVREEAARREAEASEARARHVQKLESIGVLAGGIAHDFNNLLHVVLANADLARVQLPPDAAPRDHINEVIRATQRAAELTRQLLAYSGRGTVEVRRLDLSQEVREMATLLRTAISKQATLDWELSPDLPSVTADPTQIRQVVMNLITNASDALGEGTGTISLRTGLADAREDGVPPGAHVFLEVADTGVGMGSETLERIFDPFFSTKFSGRGLGLAAVMGIVERHNGRIRIRTAPGEGTTFRIFFPAVDDSAEYATRNGPAADWRGRGTVLVVEDEEGVREVVGRMLERLGFSVLTAEDGVAAVELMDLRPKDLAAVLLDLSMPRMPGQDALKHLKARCPEVPVVLMSGYTEQEVASKLVHDSGGAAAFLQKPFLPEDLSSVLRRALASRAPA